MKTQKENNPTILKLTEQTDHFFTEQDSGFKAWDAEHILTENSHMNLLRNFKSQLLTYEQKFKKLENNKTVPIKLPVLSYLKPKKKSAKNNLTNNDTTNQQIILTERKPLNTKQQPFNFVRKHKSIDLNKKSVQMKNPKTKSSFNKIQIRQRNHTIDHIGEKNQPIIIPKVQQMKFLENQKRVRKRDLYLALFGQKGKGKVQKIEFDDQNIAYQTYLQRKNQQVKKAVTTTTATTAPSKNTQNQQKAKLRSSSQLNSRRPIKKQQMEIQITQSTNFMLKNNSHHPIRY